MTQIPICNTSILLVTNSDISSESQHQLLDFPS
ncbi:hypothetical protein LINPERPRIM_LOCUS22161 [Linum perenne]